MSDKVLETLNNMLELPDQKPATLKERADELISYRHSLSRARERNKPNPANVHAETFRTTGMVLMEMFFNQGDVEQGLRLASFANNTSKENNLDQEEIFNRVLLEKDILLANEEHEKVRECFSTLYYMDSYGKSREELHVRTGEMTEIAQDLANKGNHQEALKYCDDFYYRFERYLPEKFDPKHKPETVLETLRVQAVEQGKPDAAVSYAKLELSIDRDRGFHQNEIYSDLRTIQNNNKGTALSTEIDEIIKDDMASRKSKLYADQFSTGFHIHTLTQSNYNYDHDPYQKDRNTVSNVERKYSAIKSTL